MYVCVSARICSVMVYEGGWIGLRHRCSELTQLESVCCSDEDDNEFDDDVDT